MGGLPCGKHEECGVGLACRPDFPGQFPFTTKCMPLRGVGELCYEDEDCGMDLRCWYANRDDSTNRIKTCMAANAI